MILEEEEEEQVIIGRSLAVLLVTKKLDQQLNCK